MNRNCSPEAPASLASTSDRAGATAIDVVIEGVAVSDADVQFSAPVHKGALLSASSEIGSPLPEASTILSAPDKLLVLGLASTLDVRTEGFELTEAGPNSEPLDEG